jgi:hypothetical protein
MASHPAFTRVSGQALLRAFFMTTLPLALGTKASKAPEEKALRPDRIDKAQGEAQPPRLPDYVSLCVGKTAFPCPPQFIWP